MTDNNVNNVNIDESINDQQEAIQEAAELTTTQQPPTLAEAMVYVNSLKQIFKVQCCVCGDVKWVRKDVFAKRVEKAYLHGSDLKHVIENYVDAKCRKRDGLDFIGAKKMGGGSNVVLSKFEG
jgi:hypothetical protein